MNARQQSERSKKSSKARPKRNYRDWTLFKRWNMLLIARKTRTSGMLNIFKIATLILQRVQHKKSSFKIYDSNKQPLEILFKELRQIFKHMKKN